MRYVNFFERPEMDGPALVCAFRGWNDGGEAASTAARYLKDRWGARTFAQLDPEEFFDFQVTRPTVRLEDGVSRVIDWPSGDFAFASPQGRSIVLFNAAEPNVRWRTFTTAVIDAAKELGSRLLITFGAFLTDVTHTRPVPIVGSAADEATAERLGLQRSKYEGPTGIVGVLHDLSNKAGLPSVSLWAAVPHYVPSMPNPKAALALVQRATELLDVHVDTAPLAVAASRWEEGVQRVVEENDELSEYVGRLERASESPTESDLLDGGSVPSGDVIAEELERFLKEQGGGPG